MADTLVEVWQLVRDEEDHDVLLLRDEQGRLLPIRIGVCEAAAIWVRLAPEKAAPFLRRPWSHDLIHAMLDRLGAELNRVVIDDFNKDTFYATLHLRQHGKELVVDARPSDAIALLLRMNAPLLVNSEVMDEQAFHPEMGDDEGPGYWEEPQE